MPHSKGGNIFPSRHNPDLQVPFKEAFPEIESLHVEVTETGEGNHGLGLRRFTTLSIREFINCSNHRCGGKGVCIGEVLREMIAHGVAERTLQRPCQSREENGKPCPNIFTLQIHLHLASMDPRDSPNPFGVLAFLHWDHAWNAHHFGEADVAKAAGLMKEAGIGFVRMDFLWSDLEPQESQWRFDRYDRIVDIITAQGIKLLAVLNYNSSWSGKPWNTPPDPRAFGRYAQTVVRRYKDRIRYWEIWNEPDHPNYWQPQDDLRVYSQLLRQTYDVIKTEDASAEVLHGGLSAALPKYLRYLYEKAGGAAFDIVNVHPFVTPLSADPMGTLRTHYTGIREIMSAFGDTRKPVWFTEIGCPGVPWVKRSPQAAHWWLGESPGEEQQARWLKQIYEEALRWPGLEKIFWAFFRDTPNHFGDGVDFFGLVREDFSKKPAFEAYQRLALTSG